MFAKHSVAAGLAGWLILALPSSAAAQEIGSLPLPLVEVSAGYALMRDTTVDQQYPAGWYLSGAVNLTQWLGLVGEAGGSYWSEDTVIGGMQLALSEKRRAYTFMAGARFFHKTGRIVPFGQFLAGVERRRFEQTQRWMGDGPHGGPDTWSPPSATNFAIQPGGGVTVLLTENVGVRAAGDYRCVIDIDDDDVRNEFRFLTGFTFHWGGR